MSSDVAFDIKTVEEVDNGQKYRVRIEIPTRLRRKFVLLGEVVNIPASLQFRHSTKEILTPYGAVVLR